MRLTAALTPGLELGKLYRLPVLLLGLVIERSEPRGCELPVFAGLGAYH